MEEEIEIFDGVPDPVFFRAPLVAEDADRRPRAELRDLTEAIDAGVRGDTDAPVPDG